MNTVEFQAEIRRHAKKPKPSKGIVREYIDTRRKLRLSAKELGIGEKGIQEADGKLIRTFFARWMGTKYASLDMSFAAKTRNMLVEREASGVAIAGFDVAADAATDRILQAVVQVPVYVVAAARDETTYNHRRAGELSSGRRNGRNYSREMVHAECTCPTGFGRQHRAEFRRFLAHMIRGHAALVERGIDANRILHPGSHRAHDLPQAQAVILWRPLDEHWRVNATAVERQSGDPAVLAELLGSHYLLDFFDSPDEGPIEGVIREFSDGTL